jgi:hypothetical protein
MSKLLFILKKREMPADESTVLNQEYRPYFQYCMSSGLRNSAMFVVDMLNQNGLDSKLVEVVDNNAIDREVRAYQPTHVIIEAFWVVPEKFEVLQRLHPHVKWIIRNHSEMPFLASDGVALDWTLKYMAYRNVYIAPNSVKAYNDTCKIVESAYGRKHQSRRKVLYLPNFYNIKQEMVKKKAVSDTINVGCFGAIRPMKNHLVQAIAAISYAQKNNKKLRFHINVARIENQGSNVLKNLRGLFTNLGDNYELVEHGWLQHDEFLKLIEEMDIGLQASLSESFNIVAADFVSRGIPIIVSNEIDWLPSHFWCKPTDSDDIERTMENVLFGFGFLSKAGFALRSLIQYNKKAERIWIQQFKGEED